MSKKNGDSQLYQVWHKEAEGYVHVANTQATRLVAAIVLPDFAETQTVLKLAEASRPTTIDDVVISPDGAAYKIAPTTYGGYTFVVTDFTQERQAAEQRQDFRMGQEEAARGAFFEDILNGRAEPAPEPPKKDTGRER